MPPGPGRIETARALLSPRGIDPDFFVRTAERFPRVAAVRLGRERMYFLSHPELVDQLLVRSARWTTKSRGLQGAKRILGEGLLTSEDPWHRHARRVIAPMFHASAVESYTAGIRAAAAEMTKKWRAGQRIDVAAEFSRLTFRVVGEALFGARVAEFAAPVRSALAELLGAYNRSFLPWFEWSMRAGTPLAHRVDAAAAVLDRVIAQTLAGGSTDLVQTMLAAEFTETQIRDETMTLLLAGHETTSSALAFAVYLLATHPAAADWVRGELDGPVSLVASPAAHVDRLPRTRAVIAETMRLYPPAWVLGRRPVADLTIDGWRVPAGASCLVSQWVLHRDGRFWARPREFRPQRWLDKAGRFRTATDHRYAYFPFGGGRRICVGEAFAWTEAVLVLATVLSRWRLEPDPGYRPRLQAAITLRPAGALPMTLRPA